MRLIGLCGGSGSGKSTVAALFEKRGVPSLSADALYHELVSGPSDCLQELVATFGSDMLKQDGSLDRPRLAARVFAPDAAPLREKLNEITHRHVLCAARAKIRSFSAMGFEIVVFDVPLLFESGFDRECDLTVAVLAPLQTRVERLIRRDGLTEEDAYARIQTQLSNGELRQRTDMVIQNNGSLDDLDIQVQGVLERLRS